MKAQLTSTSSKLLIVFACFFTALPVPVATAFDEPSRNGIATTQGTENSIQNDAAVQSDVENDEKTSELAVPTRESQSASDKSSSSKNGKSQLADVGLKLGIVIGIFLIVMIVMSKKSDSSVIPKEAIEVLGRVPFSGKQALQLVRFGQKLVLVESSNQGLKPISEMTDPAEVQHMLNMINTKRR